MEFEWAVLRLFTCGLYGKFLRKITPKKFGKGGYGVVYCMQQIEYTMASISNCFVSGTFNGLTFYVVNGRQLVRTKTSINKQRFLSYPAFARLRQYSEWLKLASPIASKLYRQLLP